MHRITHPVHCTFKIGFEGADKSLRGEGEVEPVYRLDTILQKMCLGEIVMQY